MLCIVEKMCRPSIRDYRDGSVWKGFMNRPFYRTRFIIKSFCRKKIKGFTLIEVMIAMVIIGALSSIAIPAYNAYRDRAKVGKAIAEINILEGEILAFWVGNDALPNDLADINRGGFLDPWGRPYQYQEVVSPEGKKKARSDHFDHPINSDYDLYSSGADGKSIGPLTANPSWDDIIRARDGKYIGLASGF